MQQLAILDFETANHQPGSACQLGVVLVEPWRVVSEHQWLIRPQRMYFSTRCMEVHGITPRDVMDCPTWDRIWSEVQQLLDGSVVIAHNAGFDARVLSSTCQAYDIAIPPLDLQCTRLVAKKSWPSLRSHALASMAEKLEIEFRHHNALEDARAAATILIEAARLADASDLDSLEDALGLTRGRIWSDRIRTPRSIRRNRLDRVAEPDQRYEPRVFRSDGAPTQSARIRHSRHCADEILACVQGAQPLAGKHVLLVHSLLGMDREDAIGFLQQLGAIVQQKINLQTQYVIFGTHNASASLSPSLQVESGTSLDIAERQRQGQPIRILTQRQLLAMIPSGLAIARGDV
ncbi:MAG: exonuclease domain-containing protein [Planctomycetota bacterium]|jgi:DNA polymerase-3 subunit epsilon